MAVQEIATAALPLNSRGKAVLAMGAVYDGFKTSVSNVLTSAQWARMSQSFSQVELSVVSSSPSFASPQLDQPEEKHVFAGDARQELKNKFSRITMVDRGDFPLKDTEESQ
jgi:hypothetical protein